MLNVYNMFCGGLWPRWLLLWVSWNRLQTWYGLKCYTPLWFGQISVRCIELLFQCQLKAMWCPSGLLSALPSCALSGCRSNVAPTGCSLCTRPWMLAALSSSSRRSSPSATWPCWPPASSAAHWGPWWQTLSSRTCSWTTRCIMYRLIRVCVESPSCALQN